MVDSWRWCCSYIILCRWRADSSCRRCGRSIGDQHLCFDDLGGKNEDTVVRATIEVGNSKKGKGKSADARSMCKIDPKHCTKCLDSLPGNASVVLSRRRVKFNANPDNTGLECSRAGKAEVSRELHSDQYPIAQLDTFE